MTTSGNGIDLKGNKQGNCIFYCQCINFIVWNMNSFSAIALGSLCVHVQALGKVCPLSLQSRAENREIFLLVFWLVTPLGLLAAQERCSSPQQGPTSMREGGVCSHTAPAYHIKPLSKVSVIKLLTALWFLLKVVGWKHPFQRDNHVQVQSCFCSVIPLNYHSWKRLEVVFRLKFKSARITIEVKKIFLVIHA